LRRTFLEFRRPSVVDVAAGLLFEFRRISTFVGPSRSIVEVGDVSAGALFDFRRPEALRSSVAVEVDAAAGSSPGTLAGRPSGGSPVAASLAEVAALLRRWQSEHQPYFA